MGNVIQQIVPLINVMLSFDFTIFRKTKCYLHFALLIKVKIERGILF